MTRFNNRPLRFVSNAGYLWNLVFVLTMVVYAVGLFIPIMEPDAAVYAQVSMEMHDCGDYLSIYHKGRDWLDKPHFPFWMSALSYKVFGVHTFAYKLPAVVFILLAAVYTFLFGRRYYSALHGWLAVLVLITAEHIFISNQDVRAEPFMTGLVIMGLYHLAVFSDGFKRRYSVDTAGRTLAHDPIEKAGKNLWLHAVLGSLALACLIMTKGLFTIIPVVAGLALAFLYSHNWSAIFNWRWLAVALLAVAFLIPALYGYYQQFDMHPEKTIFGQNNVSGVKFFLWTSQWGRFTNTGPITGKGDPSFFVHTMIWAFLPWAFAGFYALYHKTRQLIKSVTAGENYTYFGFVSLFLIFSASKFQLSFYLNPLFPLLAIVTTAGLLGAGIKALRVFSVMHMVVCLLLAMGVVLLQYLFAAKLPHADTLLVLTAGFGVAFYIFSRKRMYLKKVFFATALAVVSVNYYVNRDFYPALMKYQAESEVGYLLKEQGIPGKDLVFVGDVQSVADVILHHTTPIIPLDSIATGKIAGKFVFTSPAGVRKIDSLGLRYDILAELDDFHVTRLTGKFINRNTRSAELQQKLLLKTDSADFRKPGVEITGN